ncbi:MAG: antibiotic biosynthesis monooxygenase [Planctomycetota bacterium]
MTGDGGGQARLVHCAILRTAREGKEREFEEAIKRFIARSISHEATTGAHLLHPSSASRPREYGILRAFKSQEARKRFYDSELFREWLDEVEPLVEGDMIEQPLHGLEAFFRGGGQIGRPPRWKMAIVTWLGVFPVVLFWSRTLANPLSFLPSAILTAVIVFASVVTLTWSVMPLLTKLFAPWLHTGKNP